MYMRPVIYALLLCTVAAVVRIPAPAAAELVGGIAAPTAGPAAPATQPAADPEVLKALEVEIRSEEFARFAKACERIVGLGPAAHPLLPAIGQTGHTYQPETTAA